MHRSRLLFPNLTSKHPAGNRYLAALSALFLLALASLVQAQEPAERERIKLLTVGNSFANNALHYLPALAEAGGKTLLIGRANIGGCSLERHARHLAEALAGDPAGLAYTSFINPETGERPDRVSLLQALEALDWDIVTVQQVSHQSFRPESYQPYADEVVAAIRKYAPQAEIVIHQTWAYRPDHPFFQRDDGFTQQAMYEGLREAYHQWAASEGFRILPSGDAMQLARQTPTWQYQPDPDFDFKNPPEDTLPDQSGSLTVGWQWRVQRDGTKSFRLDAIHANEAGRYLAACVWYLELFQTDTLPDSFVPKGLTPEQAQDLRRIATEAVTAERLRRSQP